MNYGNAKAPDLRRRHRAVRGTGHAYTDSPRQLRATNGTERQLDRVMNEAFEHVTYKTKVQAKSTQNLTEAQLYADRAVDRDWYLDMISAINKPEMAKGYG